jgi:uncharacterized membrane protein
VAPGTAQPAAPGRVAVQVFRVTNSGQGEDLMRVKAATADGWTTSLAADVIDVPAGATVDVPVYVAVPEGAAGSTTLTFTATSETDATKSASSTAPVVPAS